MSEPPDVLNRLLAGQTAVVTGGASGIGRCTCHALARRGASIAVVDRNESAIGSVLAELDAVAPGVGRMGIRCDVSREAEVAAMVERTKAHFQRIDILVHSAGILRAPGSVPMVMAQLTAEEFDLVIATNIRGTFLCNRAVLPVMFAQRSGQIVNVGSTSGRTGRPLDSAYCASKFGVVGLTQSLAEEVRSFGIRVQLVLPDAVATPLWEQNGPVPAPDWALPPERVADVIAYMLCLPPDTSLGEVAIRPVHTRKQRARKAGSDQAESTR